MFMRGIINIFFGFKSNYFSSSIYKVYCKLLVTQLHLLLYKYLTMLYVCAYKTRVKNSLEVTNLYDKNSSNIML